MQALLWTRESATTGTMISTCVLMPAGLWVDGSSTFALLSLCRIAVIDLHRIIVMKCVFVFHLIELWTFLWLHWQGTTRPTHYHVLYDEIGFTPDDLQELVHSLSYVYALWKLHQTNTKKREKLQLLAPCISLKSNLAIDVNFQVSEEHLSHICR